MNLSSRIPIRFFLIGFIVACALVGGTFSTGVVNAGGGGGGAGGGGSVDVDIIGSCSASCGVNSDGTCNCGGGTSTGGGTSGGGTGGAGEKGGGGGGGGGGGIPYCRTEQTMGRNDKTVTRCGCPSGYVRSGNFCIIPPRTTPSSPGGSSCSALNGQVCQSAPNNNCAVPLTNVGRYQCNGTCNATTPPNSSCPLPVVTVTSTPGAGGVRCDVGGNCSQTVNKGNSCTISFTVNNATRCTITGPGVNQTLTVPPPSHSFTTPPIEVTTLYTITCQNGPVVYTAKTFNCKMNPIFQEI